MQFKGFSESLGMYRKQSKAVLALVLYCGVLAGCDWVTVANFAPDGSPPDYFSSGSSVLSGDGRYLAFSSGASNLVPGDVNTHDDVFVRDMATGTIERVSVAPDGTDGNQGSNTPSISSDGRYVVFMSYASNLVLGDTNGQRDIFMRDMIKNVTTRISVATDGTESDGLSSSFSDVISADGRYVVFSSSASNLVADPPTYCYFDSDIGKDVCEIGTYLHDTQTGSTSRVNVASDGTLSNRQSFVPSISDDGNHVVFTSRATNLVPGTTAVVMNVYLRDLQAGTTSLASVSHDGSPSVSEVTGGATISADGRYVAFTTRGALVPEDTNNLFDVFLRDTHLGTTSRVSVASDGSEGNGSSSRPVISADGRFVAFDSFASNLVQGDDNGAKEPFLHDTLTERTTALVRSANGELGDSGGGGAAFSGDGRYASFTSISENLIDGAGGSVAGVFVTIVQPVGVHAVSPAVLPKGSVTQVEVTGAGFEAGNTTVLVSNGEVTNVVVLAEDRLLADVQVPADAKSGPQNVVVAKGGGGAGPFTGSSRDCDSCVSFF